MMKQVLIIGASGRAGAAIVNQLNTEDFHLTLVSRSITDETYPEISAERYAMNAEDSDVLAPLVKGQDVIVVVSNGDALSQAESLLRALEQTDGKPERIIWLTGMGIHGEVPGPRGLVYKALAMTMKSYIQAADKIAASPYPSLLLRAPRIVEEEVQEYQLTHEGEEISSQKVSYTAIGRFIASLLTGEVLLDEKESLGITY